MGITFKQSRDLDKVLQHLEDNKGEVYDLDRIKKDVLPNHSVDEIRLLYYFLEDNYYEILLPISGPKEYCFWTNDKASSLIYSGGISKWFDDEIEIQNREQLREDLEMAQLKYGVKNAKRIYKTYWWTFGIALAALLFSLWSLLLNIF